MCSRFQLYAQAYPCKGTLHTAVITPGFHLIVPIAPLSRFKKIRDDPDDWHDRQLQIIVACSWRSDSGVRCVGREREKNREEKRERGKGGFSLSPLPHPLVVFFSCSHLFARSPRSERLEQTKIIVYISSSLPPVLMGFIVGKVQFYCTVCLPSEKKRHGSLVNFALRRVQLFINQVYTGNLQEAKLRKSRSSERNKHC